MQAVNDNFDRDQWERILDQASAVELTNHEKIALAHTVRELIEPVIERGTKLSFEQANGIVCSYYTMRRMVEHMDPQIFTMHNGHNGLLNFYRQRDSRELSNDGDRLSWDQSLKQEQGEDTEATEVF